MKIDFSETRFTMLRIVMVVSLDHPELRAFGKTRDEAVDMLEKLIKSKMDYGWIKI